MLKLSELIHSPVTPDAVLTLTFEQRQRSRLRVTLDDGRAAALVLARGTRLRDGDRLRAQDGTIVGIAAAPEPVTTITCADPHLLARACYHLGNRHIALQVEAGWLRYQQDPVLDDLARGLGLAPLHGQAPFEPEAGAYGHAHGSEQAAPALQAASGHEREHLRTVPGGGSALLSLLRLTSASLPIGSFAYSQGMEYAVEQGWVADAAGAGAWIAGLLRHVQRRQDLPVFVRLYRAWEANDPAAIRHWNARLLAMRESRELRAEEINVGAALARLLADLGIGRASGALFRERVEDEERAPALSTASEEREDVAGYLAMFALACVEWRIPLFEAACGLAWSWCQNQVAAAIRLVPLGQTAGQRILQESIVQIPAVVEEALALADRDIGFTAPGLALASARHERQYTRLFLS
jgi:urease accessory protein